jgi:hypothetical protein
MALGATAQRLSPYKSNYLIYHFRQIIFRPINDPTGLTYKQDNFKFDQCPEQISQTAKALKAFWYQLMFASAARCLGYRSCAVKLIEDLQGYGLNSK